MYWSWLQSTGAEMRKYLTVFLLASFGKRVLLTRCVHESAYGCLLVAMQRPNLLASSAAHLGRGGRFRVQLIAVAAVAWTGGAGGWDT